MIFYTNAGIGTQWKKLKLNHVEWLYKKSKWHCKTTLYEK